MDQGDSLMYSWLTRDGIHSVSVSIRGKLTLWHLPSRYLLVSVDIGGPMQCWDEEVDTEGITIIVNAQTRAPGGASSTFYAYRYDFMTKECNLVVTQTIHGGLECNYIQGNLMGCICQDNGAITIYIIESTSQRRAKIKVLAPRVSAEYFSSFMSVTHGGCYVNMGSTGYYYPFSLEDLKARLAFPMSESTLQLPLIGKYYFDHSEELEESDWGPRCGYTWDGRLGVFSRAVFGPLWSTLILLEHKEIELADGTSYIDEESKVPIKVLEGSLITQHSVHRFVKSKGGWDLYAVGIRAKASLP
ncbi:hypothetical protein FS842_006909 [Serendipita sp. 407]|nr:hypothetical protein FS842_006909 [Serendipita sp. 407]